MKKAFILLFFMSSLVTNLYGISEAEFAQLRNNPPATFGSITVTLPSRFSTARITKEQQFSVDNLFPSKYRLSETISHR